MVELYDPKVESTLISTLAQHNEALRQNEPDINPEYFYDARCRAIIDGLLELYRHHKIAAPTTLADTLLQMELLDQAGGTDHIHHIFNSGAEQPQAAANLLSIVRDHWRRRQEIQLARQIENTATDRTQDSLTRFSQLKEAITSLETTLSEKSGYDTQAQFDYYLNVTEQRQKNIDKKRLSLPYPKLQKLVPQLPEGSLVGILGNPGAGKTALMECISDRWKKAGFNGVYYHAEDSLTYKLDRRMARWASLPYYRSGQKFTDAEYQSIFKAWQMIEDWPGETHFVHCPGWTMRQIISHATRLISENEIDYFVLDYLNKLAWDDRGMGLNTAQMRGRDIEDFKEFLEQNNLIGLMGGQFDKRSKGGRNRELSNLRDSGELDDKAQVGLIIERQKDEAGQWENHCQLRVSKCNFGSTGAVLLYFIGERYLFTEQPGGL